MCEGELKVKIAHFRLLPECQKRVLSARSMHDVACESICCDFTRQAQI